MKSVAVTRSGLELPVLGQGTWRMGEDPSRRTEEVAALTLGLDLGMNLIDTAEMYADGGAEIVTAEAIQGRRDEVVLVSKVLPQNASFAGTIRAAEASLERLRTDRLDLYLLHWSGSHPLDRTLEAFERLVEQGKILHYGVSNFDPTEMEQAEKLPGGSDIASNQVLYSIEKRGIEFRLLPWCREKKIAVMAYSPLEKGRLNADRTLEAVAGRHGCTPYQIALAWTLRDGGVVAVPKASNPDHVRENAAVGKIRLTPEDLAELDGAFPPPSKEVPLDVA